MQSNVKEILVKARKTFNLIPTVKATSDGNYKTCRQQTTVSGEKTFCCFFSKY